MKVFLLTLSCYSCFIIDFRSIKFQFCLQAIPFGAVVYVYTINGVIIPTPAGVKSVLFRSCNRGRKRKQFYIIAKVLVLNWLHLFSRHSSPIGCVTWVWVTCRFHFIGYDSVVFQNEVVVLYPLCLCTAFPTFFHPVENPLFPKVS